MRRYNQKDWLELAKESTDFWSIITATVYWGTIAALLWFYLGWQA